MATPLRCASSSLPEYSNVSPVCVLIHPKPAHLHSLIPSTSFISFVFSGEYIILIPVQVQSKGKCRSLSNYWPLVMQPMFCKKNATGTNRVQHVQHNFKPLVLQLPLRMKLMFQMYMLELQLNVFWQIENKSHFCMEHNTCSCVLYWWRDLCILSLYLWVLFCLA